MGYNDSKNNINFYCTNRNGNIDGARDGRFQVRIKNYRTEQYFMTRLVDCFVRLDEHGIAFMDIVQRRAVEEVESVEALCSQVVGPGPEIADLGKKCWHV